MTDHRRWMSHAYQCALHARELGEVPVGAVLVQSGKIIARGWNCPISAEDPGAHAEIMALRKGGSILHNCRLPQTSLYVTLEPCLMCAGAMIHARIANLYFGAFDPKTGVGGTVFNAFNLEFINHRVNVSGGIMEQECAELLREFFAARR